MLDLYTKYTAKQFKKSISMHIIVKYQISGDKDEIPKLSKQGNI